MHAGPQHVLLLLSALHRAAAAPEGRHGDGGRDGDLRERAVVRRHRRGLVPVREEDGGQREGEGTLWGGGLLEQIQS